MSFLPTPALLPAGLRDLLPPDSTQEARLVSLVTNLVATHGYELVKPPLVEFEETLLSGSGQSLARQTFRLMDPLSQRMMAVRRDITLQIARIASSRLMNSPRPLRLAYSGEVLRVSGTQLYPQRQFCQIGCELIGSDAVPADAEIVLLAAEALKAAGIDGISIDLNLPTFVPSLAKIYNLQGEEARAFLAAATNRDPRQVKHLGAEKVGLLESLLHASGPVETALAAMDSLSLPQMAQDEMKRLRQVIALIKADQPDLTITVDPLERRGFEYHEGFSFTLFVQALGEVGRGGRYRTGQNGEGEPATGFTILTDSILPALPARPLPEKVLLAAGASAGVIKDLHDKGYVTLRMLDDSGPRDAARRLGCAYVWDGGLQDVERDE